MSDKKCEICGFWYHEACDEIECTDERLRRRDAEIAALRDRLARLDATMTKVVATVAVGPCGFHCPPDCAVMREIVAPLLAALAALGVKVEA